MHFEVFKNKVMVGPAGQADVPRAINLGSGKDWRADYLNIDILPQVYPDLVLDVCSDLPWGLDINTVRFRSFALTPGYFHKIMANDVLEHLPNLTKAMRSCLDLLAEGGEFHIQVPYDLSYGAWQDPTHVRAFNERSWLYYSDWHWYLGWTDYKFAVAKLDFIMSDYGQKMKAEKLADDFIVKTPRAVDAMQVILVKTRL